MSRRNKIYVNNYGESACNQQTYTKQYAISVTPNWGNQARLQKGTAMEPAFEGGIGLNIYG